MSISIDVPYRSRAVVVINDATLTDAQVTVIRRALLRHLTELTASIASTQGQDVMSERRNTAIENRRKAFTLLERFDGLRPDHEEDNAVARWLGHTAMRLPQSDEQLLLYALRWYRDQWETEHDRRDCESQTVIQLIEPTN